MSLASLLPVGGAALGMLAARTLSGLSEGLSFKSQLAGSQPSPSDNKVASATEARVSLNLAEAVPQFVADLRERFQAAGVDLSQPFMLKDDGTGAVIVEGDHPDRSTIERILAQDPKLLSEFQAISAAASERRQTQPMGMDNAFGEFRLSFANEGVAIRFE